jgi:hypothetical protein
VTTDRPRNLFEMVIDQKISHLSDAIKGMSEEMSLTADTLTELSRYRSIEEVAPRIDHGSSIYRGPFI